MLFLILIIYSSNKFMKGLTYNLNTVAWTTYLHGAKKTIYMKPPLIC